MKIVPTNLSQRITVAVLLTLSAVVAYLLWPVGAGDQISPGSEPGNLIASFRFTLEPETETVSVSELFVNNESGVIQAAEVNAQFSLDALAQSYSPPTFTIDAAFQKIGGAENPNVYSRTSVIEYSDGVSPHPTLQADRCGDGVGSEIEATPPGSGFNVGSFFDISYVLTLPRTSQLDFFIDIHEGPSGCLNNAPTAIDDEYDSLGNTELAVGLTPPATPTIVISGSVLDNDFDPDSDPLTVVADTDVTTQSGTFDINSAGEFRYWPAPGFNGVDTFVYAIEDGNSGSDTGTVSLNITDLVWFVDRDATAGGDGRSHSPFHELAPLSTGGSSDGLDGAGDTIFIYEGAGPTPGGIVLENNQQLIGQGVDLSFPTFSPDPLVSQSGPPTISASTVAGVRLASDNTVRGLNISTSGVNGIDGSSVGVLTISDVPLVVSSGGHGIDINGGSGAAVDVDLVEVTNGGGGGIDIASSSGTFTFSDLDITTTNGTGLRAQNSGTVTVAGGTATISTTNGVGLEITNSTIGAGGVTFRSIDASGSANGIVLSNTGSSGGLTVTGLGSTAGSGGTIGNTTSDGIVLTNTSDVELSNMDISSTGRHGINGTGVSGLSIEQLRATNVGNAGNEHGITLSQLTGSARILNSTIINAADHNVHVVNSSGTLDLLRVEDSIFTGGPASTHGGSGVIVSLSNTAIVTSVQIGDTTSTADGSDDTQFADMSGFGVSLVANGSSTFTGVTIDDIEVSGAKAGGVLLATDNNASGTFSLTNSMIEADNAAAVAVGADGDSTARARVVNNTTDVINTSFFGVSNIAVRADGNVVSDAPDLRILLDSNTIDGGDAFGINATSRGSQGSLDLTVTNNTVSNVGDDGMRIRAGNGTGGETDTVRVYLEGNDATTSIGSQGYDLRDQSASTSVEIGCNGGVFSACSSLIGSTAGNDQGVIAGHGNLGTTNFNAGGLFTIIDWVNVNLP